MPWLQLKFSTTQPHVDEVSDFLSEQGALSLTYEDAEDKPILEPLPGETPLWEALNVTALFDANCDTETVLKACAASHLKEQIQSARFEQLEDKDWERAWMDNFHPIQFGEQLWVVPSWCEPPNPEAVNLLLDPGLAFGTGTHPTTGLCLQWLDSADLNDKSLLDFGCGSGILAVAAKLLGSNNTMAVDIDPQAILATKENMSRNGIPNDGIAVGLPEIAENHSFDIVVANILAGPLKTLAPAIAEKVKPGGYLVLSGLLAEQAEEISQHYQKWFTMQPAVQQEDWIRLEGRKVVN